MRAALRGFTRPRELRDSPLLRSQRLLARSAPDALEAERVPQLQALLRRAADTLQKDPRRARYRDALHHAYFHPASSPEQAARLLYVSFSTFRRNLKAQAEHVVGTLWDWERTGREPDDTGGVVD